MAACRGCHCELEQRAVGCVACSPVVDLSVFGDIERDPKWPLARGHKVGSSRAKIFLLIGFVILGAMALLWPSYSDAVDHGDTSGRPLIIIGLLLGGAALLVGILYLLAKLHHHAAVVLTTTFHVSTDSDGRKTTHYGAHLRTRSRPLLLTADFATIKLLSPGDLVIAFERRAHLEDVWPLSLERAAQVQTAAVATKDVVNEARD